MSAADNDVISSTTQTSCEELLRHCFPGGADVFAKWRRGKQGKPVIRLGPGGNCLDLAKLLRQGHIKPQHLLAIREWLEKREDRISATGTFQLRTRDHNKFQ